MARREIDRFTDLSLIIGFILSIRHGIESTHVRKQRDLKKSMAFFWDFLKLSVSIS